MFNRTDEHRRAAIKKEIQVLYISCGYRVELEFAYQLLTFALQPPYHQSDPKWVDYDAWYGLLQQSAQVVIRPVAYGQQRPEGPQARFLEHVEVG